ncbi:hypothetical protein K435DRAFT_974820, partial [Dendrothele bispora CBS 962.96]
MMINEDNSESRPRLGRERSKDDFNGTSFLDLPDELVEIIIDELRYDAGSLRTCSILCRRLLCFAQKHLHHSLVLHHSTNYAAFLHLMQTTSSHLAGLVKKVSIPDYYENYQWLFCNSDLLRVFSLLTKIEELQFPSHLYKLLEIDSLYLAKNKESQFPPHVRNLIENDPPLIFGRTLTSVLQLSSLKSVSLTTSCPVPDEAIVDILRLTTPNLEQFFYNGVSLLLRKHAQSDGPVDILAFHMIDPFGYEYMAIMACPNPYNLSHLNDLSLHSRTGHELTAHREFLRSTKMSLRRLIYGCSTGMFPTFLDLSQLSQLKVLGLHYYDYDHTQSQAAFVSFVRNILLPSLQSLPPSCPLEDLDLRLQIPRLTDHQANFFDDEIWAAVDHSCVRPDLVHLRQVSVRIAVPDQNHDYHDVLPHTLEEKECVDALPLRYLASLQQVLVLTRQKGLLRI